MEYINLVTNIIAHPVSPFVLTAGYLLFINLLRISLRPVDKNEKEKINAYYEKITFIHNFILGIESLVNQKKKNLCYLKRGKKREVK